MIDLPEGPVTLIRHSQERPLNLETVQFQSIGKPGLMIACINKYGALEVRQRVIEHGERVLIRGR